MIARIYLFFVIFGFVGTLSKCNFISPNSHDESCMIEKPDVNLNLNCTNRLYKDKKVTSFSQCKRKCCSDPDCDMVEFTRGHCNYGKYENLKKCRASFSFQSRSKVAFKLLKFNQYKNYLNFLTDSSKKCDGESSRFYCDQKNTCIAKHKICDGIFDCLDGSDEADCGPEVCTDYQGNSVKIGDTYQPSSPADNCMICICNRNRSLHLCMSPSCSSSSSAAHVCSAQHHCCLSDASVCDPVDYRRLHLNGTQQMVVTGLLILLIVTIVVIFSRQIFRRHVFYHQLRLNRRRNLPDRMMRGSFTPLNRADAAELILRPCNDEDGGDQSISTPVPPPSYSDLYKCTCGTSVAGGANCTCVSIPLTEAPPSYPGSSRCSIAVSLNDVASSASSSFGDETRQNEPDVTSPTTSTLTDSEREPLSAEGNTQEESTGASMTT